MHTTTATADEVDAWITVPLEHGHLHRAEPGPDRSWTVQRTPASLPHTLHHPVLAKDYVAEALRALRAVSDRRQP